MCDGQQAARTEAAASGSTINILRRTKTGKMSEGFGQLSGEASGHGHGLVDCDGFEGVHLVGFP